MRLRVGSSQFVKKGWSVDIHSATTLLTAVREDDVMVAPYCPQRPYVELHLPRSVQRVQSITFNIVSHDQGYCDDPNSVSWTWFDAHLSRPMERDLLLPITIHTNVVGEWAYRQRTVTWTSEDADPKTRNIVNSLEESDCIQVIPKARFPGWRNYIRKVAIEVRCTRLDSVPTAPLQHESAPTPAYKPLQQNLSQIRLLYLDPGDKDDLLSCRLVTASLLDPNLPPFEALSYCWGNMADKRPLKLSPQHLQEPFGYPEDNDAHHFDTLYITPNLDEALRHLRLLRKHRVLWVDAVCIDQTNIQERNTQVQMMGKIYSTATSVVIWLGIPDDVVLQALEVLRLDFMGYQQWETTRGTRITLPYTDSLPKSTWDTRSASMVKSLTHFLNYPWFRRTWVIQELWLSKAAVVRCGDYTVPWNAVMLANYWLDGGGSPGIAWAPLSALWTSVAKSQNIICEASQLHEQGSSVAATNKDLGRTPDRQRLKMLNLLLGSLDFRATDPRDKIFALLGLGEETHACVPELLRPNYQKSVIQVYLDFTRWWIETYKSLAILSAVHANTRRTWQKLDSSQRDAAQEVSSSQDGYPSWVLNCTGDGRWAESILGLQSNFRATGDTQVRLGNSDVDPDHGTIVLQGECLGRITEIGRFPFLFESELSDDDDDIDMWAAFTRIFDPPAALGTWNLMRAREREAGLCARDLLDHQYAHIQLYSSDDPEGDTVEQRHHGYACFSDCYFKLQPAPAITAATSDKDAEALLTDGLRGLCPDGTRTKDWVVLFHGGKVPYVLREAQPKGRSSQSIEGQETDAQAARSFYFIGECYLKGQMDGRAFEARRQANSTELEWFTLI